jgi:hypothetical protein
MQYTFEEVKEYIESFGCKLYSNQYLGVKNNSLDILFLCGHRDIISFRTFVDKREKKCNKCNKIKLGNTIEEQRWINKINIAGFEFVEFPNDYINKESLISYKCPKNHITIKRLDAFLAHPSCNECCKESKFQYNLISEKDAYKRLYEVHGDTIGMGNYTRTNNYAHFKCNICGHEWDTTPESVFRGSGCENCYHIRQQGLQTKPIDRALQELYNAHGNKITLITYTGSKSICSFLCNVCGNTWDTTLSSVIKNKIGCKRCSIGYGINSSQWKGGITPLHNFLRSQIKNWIQDSFASNDWRCVITGEKAQVVHHLYSFSMILQETIINTNSEIKSKIQDYIQEELDIIVNEFLRLHYFYGYGVPITRHIHKLFHTYYGKGDTIPVMWYEFVDRIDSGEIQI